ncbi:hypothetical protein [Sporosarcina sp. 6E9]|uniref:hypothetical protein n=1 Tax=Sporosarcina sp. 6E9 TaxID=2819235 RepID=UPI001B314C24|nr:hypothetical protein [Sporosarcina sp. 6E9]
MKMGISGLLGFGLLLLVIIMLFIYARFSNIEMNIDTNLSHEKWDVSLEEANDYLESYHMEVGFYKKMGERLREKGYEHSLHAIMDDENEIRIKITLSNKKATEQERIEVKKILEETAINHKLDPKIFKVEVINDDSSNG